MTDSAELAIRDASELVESLDPSVRVAFARKILGAMPTRYLVVCRAGASTTEPSWAIRWTTEGARKATRVFRRGIGADFVGYPKPDAWEPMWAWPVKIFDDFCCALSQAAGSFQIYDTQLHQFLGAQMAGTLEAGWRLPRFSPGDEVVERRGLERAAERIESVDAEPRSLADHGEVRMIRMDDSDDEREVN